MENYLNAMSGMSKGQIWSLENGDLYTILNSQLCFYRNSSSDWRPTILAFNVLFTGLFKWVADSEKDYNYQQDIKAAAIEGSQILRKRKQMSKFLDNEDYHKSPCPIDWDFSKWDFKVDTGVVKSLEKPPSAPVYPAAYHGHRVHILKSTPDDLFTVWKHSKEFEIRKNDRRFQKGDLLILKDSLSLPALGKERVIVTEIKYVSDYEQQSDYVVLGLGLTLNLNLGLLDTSLSYKNIIGIYIQQLDN